MFKRVAGVAEWQTHQTQNLTGATSCRFKSGHRQFKEFASNVDLSMFGAFFIYRKVLKMSDMVYNKQEIENDMTKERRGLRHDVVYEVFCFGLGDCTI